jgi:hypothetical protein
MYRAANGSISGAKATALAACPFGLEPLPSCAARHGALWWYLRPNRDRRKDSREVIGTGRRSIKEPFAPISQNEPFAFSRPKRICRTKRKGNYFAGRPHAQKEPYS